MIKIVDANGDAQEVEVIRYFQLNSNNYLLYSLGEKDEQNYVKLYGNKVDNGQGISIVDEEWDGVKEEIKRIIKGNKEGNLEVADLNHKELDGLVTNDSRAFKLSSDLVDLLKANQKEFAEEKVEEQPTQEEPTQEVPAQDFDLGLDANESEEPEAADITPEAPKPEVPESEEAPVETPEEPVQETPVAEPKPEEPAAEETPVDAPKPEEAPAEEPKPEGFADLEPTDVGNVSEESKTDFEELYKESQEVQKVLKAEVDDLKEKLAKIAKVLGE